MCVCACPSHNQSTRWRPSLSVFTAGPTYYQDERQEQRAKALALKSNQGRCSVPKPSPRARASQAHTTGANVQDQRIVRALAAIERPLLGKYANQYACGMDQNPWLATGPEASMQVHGSNRRGRRTKTHTDCRFGPVLPCQAGQSFSTWGTCPCRLGSSCA